MNGVAGNKAEQRADSRSGAIRAESARSPGPSPWRFLILVRVANFALIRRMLGRTEADRLSGEMARLSRALLPGATVSAAAPDTVEIAMTGTSRAGLDRALRKLDKQLSRHFAAADGRSELDLLFGAAAGRGREVDEIGMIEQAELALRQATGERRTVVQEADPAASAVDRIALTRDLARAVERGELILHYQPKMHVRRQCVASVEALLRWRHPERGMVMPGEFIPLVEETRTITSMTLWTIRQAVVDQAVLAAQGHDLRIFVNIAGAMLSDATFVADACALLKGRADRIGFEITETSVIRDPESAIANLQTFADIGVVIAIDDYGAGLSSLAYLKRLPARELKIDKLFVTQLTSSNRDPLIVRSTIDLAHALEMEVVAEGVETQAALALLSVMGCDLIQGFLISRPVGLNALLAYLQDGRHTDAIEDSRATFNRLAATWKRS